MFGLAPFGAASFGTAGGEITNNDPYIRVLSLRLIVTAGEAVRSKLYLQARVYERFAPALPLALRTHAARITPTLPISLTVFGRITSVLGLALTVNTPSAIPGVGEAYIWAAKVVMADVDVSGRVTGQIEIDADEDSARVARLSLAPAGSPLGLSNLAKRVITIDLVRSNSSGVTIGIFRLFTGWVDTSSYDADTRMLQLTCTDGKQAKILAMTRSQIDALVRKRNT